MTLLSVVAGETFLPSIFTARPDARARLRDFLSDEISLDEVERIGI